MDGYLAILNVLISNKLQEFFNVCQAKQHLAAIHTVVLLLTDLAKRQLVPLL